MQQKQDKTWQYIDYQIISQLSIQLKEYGSFFFNFSPLLYSLLKNYNKSNIHHNWHIYFLIILITARSIYVHQQLHVL